MTARLPCIVLALVAAATADDGVPISLSGENHPPICRQSNLVPGCITAPRATYAPDPEYPAKASRKRQTGTVLLSLVVRTDGSASDVKVTRALTPDLDKSAIDCVKKWKFTSALKDGNPIPVQIMVQVSFNIR